MKSSKFQGGSAPISWDFNRSKTWAPGRTGRTGHQEQTAAPLWMRGNALWHCYSQFRNTCLNLPRPYHVPLFASSICNWPEQGMLGSLNPLPWLIWNRSKENGMDGLQIAYLVLCKHHIGREKWFRAEAVCFVCLPSWLPLFPASLERIGALWGTAVWRGQQRGGWGPSICSPSKDAQGCCSIFKSPHGDLTVELPLLGISNFPFGTPQCSLQHLHLY